MEVARGRLLFLLIIDLDELFVPLENSLSFSLVSRRPLFRLIEVALLLNLFLAGRLNTYVVLYCRYTGHELG